MTFLNATLIFGVAAASVPIVLHLIARREPRQVVFPSIRFLTKRFDSNRSRIRIKRWWLLALRIAAIVAFALALARPAIDRSFSVTWLTIGLVIAAGVALLAMATVALARGQSRRLAFGLTAAALVLLLVGLCWGGYAFAVGPPVSIDNAAPVAMAIVLDNSPTSTWKATDDDRVQRMRDLAAWMVTRLPPTSRIAIVDRSAQPVAFSLDVAGAISKLEQLQPLQVVQPIATRIDSAIRLVRTSELASRQVLVITDLTAATWDDSTREAGLAATVGQTPPVSLTVFDLGEFDKANRVVRQLRLEDPTPAVDTSVSVSWELALLGGNETSSMSVTAELQLFQSDPTLPVIRDGKVKLPPLRSVNRASVQLAAGGSSQQQLSLPPLPVGTHHGQVRLVGEDALPLDDVRYFTLRVWPPTPLLLVCDDENEARVMQLAISEEFSVERITQNDFPVVRLADYPAVILIDPPADLIQDEALLEFVTQGGSLLVCLGPAAGEDALETAGMPKMVRRWRATEPGTFFQYAAPSHPLVAPLAQVAGGIPWGSYRVRQYWQLETTAADQVLMLYAATDHPALSERLFRREKGPPGRWLTLTTPLPALARPTRPWNELFTASEFWPAFLLVRQSAEYLGNRGGQPLISPVGQPQLIHLEPRQADGGEVFAARRLQLFPPGQSAAVPLEVSSESDPIVVSDVPRAGTYWLRGAGDAVGFSANLPDQATDLARLNPADLDQVFGPDGYTLASDRDDIELADRQSQQRVMLQSPLMLLALLVFLLEQVLGNRFYRARGDDHVSTNIRSSAA
ncbi:MAG: BatA domain-containing protein [Pirellulales bacterium]|nr:BatA domain-containing protein [Pirellulales bacterium]